MSSAHVAALAGVDRLYAGVVMNPEAWPDGALEDWVLELSAESPPRTLARELRRCMRVARKLRDFWLDPPPGVPSDAGDWRTRVDVALGIRAWRPVLEIARDGLAGTPTEQLFEETRRRFREVHGTAWMEGLSYEEYLEVGGRGA